MSTYADGMNDVWDAKDPYGGPRFYRPGTHPATARMRAQLRVLNALPQSPERDEAVAYLNERVAEFEAGEAEARANYLRYLRRPGSDTEEETHA